jgi:hypothetical protein
LTKAQSGGNDLPVCGRSSGERASSTKKLLTNDTNFAIAVKKKDQAKTL